MKNQMNRKRNIIVNFRMSAEEKELLEKRILLSGKKKQEYFIESCLEQKLNIFANRKVVMELKNQLKSIEVELKCLLDINQLSNEKINTLHTVVQILEGFNEEEKSL